MNSIISRIKEFIYKGDSRTSLAKKNILGSFIVRFFDVVISFVLVPISLAYLTQTEYGIWLTISSIVSWLNFFDIGISHGFRNKLAEALSTNNYKLAKTYTSTAYVTIGIISLVIALSGFLLAPRFDWVFILNTSPQFESILIYVVLAVIVGFSVKLSLKIITSVFLAYQMPFWKDVVNVLSKLLILLGIVLLLFIPEKKFLWFAIAYSGMPLLALVLISLFFFSKKYKEIRPSFRYFDQSKIKSLMGLGLKFFVIQIGVVVLFSSDNFIISHVLDPSHVTPYQVSHKYFGITLIIFSIVMSPFWSAITDAYIQNEFDWIEKIIRKLEKFWLLIIPFNLFLLLIFYPALHLWVGGGINVPLLLAFQWVLFVTLQQLNMIYTYFLNGTGKIFLQMVTGIITVIINIPLSILFAKYMSMGSAGVLLATNFSVCLYIITRRIQYYKIIKQNAYGVWNK